MEDFVLSCPTAAPRAPAKRKALRKPKTETAQHSAKSSEWYTPPSIVTPATQALGGVIDLDPASSVLANEQVRAVAYYSQAQDGLTHEWHGNVWLNPPTPPMPWWRKLVAEWRAGRVRRGCFLSYNIDFLTQIAAATPDVLDDDAATRVCIVRGRLRFLCTASDRVDQLTTRLAKPFEDDADRRAVERKRGRILELPQLSLVPGDGPTHGSAIVGLGIDLGTWRTAFSPLGACR